MGAGEGRPRVRPGSGNRVPKSQRRLGAPNQRIRSLGQLSTIADSFVGIFEAHEEGGGAEVNVDFAEQRGVRYSRTSCSCAHTIAQGGIADPSASLSRGF